MEIASYWSLTRFKIADTTSCGEAADGWWRLPTSTGNSNLDAALPYKKSMLLAAFSAAKRVQLRCESGFITDFVIVE